MNSANEFISGDNNGDASKLLEKRTLNPNNGTYLPGKRSDDVSNIFG
jgi:hypothetical protein